MKKEDIIRVLSKKIKLVRTEAGYSQDLMAEILGISKKTLVQIEKSRILASWSVIVTLCALFTESAIIQATLGEDPIDILQVVAHQYYETPKEKTLGGKIWWKEIKQLGKFKLQQNIVSNHFRILDNQNNRWISSFDELEMKNKLIELNKYYDEE
ncbi:helix-turn-helix transcriptional regulator [Crassaminicella profunda]|uniref:helix-turn-helix transcriptional regulator n=1 Tax=Crassaminicella profunda TaxID=1286698 RepID=UPI001CA611BD|nr:helix-turn-helix domain-containing protein [Crassaminicella profunda]QZY56217.1 helix-turn-helix domain-containing protein [Crassaminicella profunda]